MQEKPYTILGARLLNFGANLKALLKAPLA